MKGWLAPEQPFSRMFRACFLQNALEVPELHQAFWRLICIISDRTRGTSEVACPYDINEIIEIRRLPSLQVDPQPPLDVAVNRCERWQCCRNISSLITRIRLSQDLVPHFQNPWLLITPS
jgi:hypothetical protein